MRSGDEVKMISCGLVIFSITTTFSVFTKALSCLAIVNGDVTQDKMFFVTSFPSREVGATNHETIDNL